ncbi:MAG TPA: BlaI/MecI/CopY family transcriptional regulator [Blastocatellia bacterium]|nr:BlaI/MecI/CopY family transcriptional regulator [Blastocatellia bacterium]
MARKENVKLTKFELEIMHALWELGTASVREIQEQLPEKKRPAYTTVQTIVRRLEEKGAVRKLKKIGNAFVFEPVVTRKSAHFRLINELLDLFGGSARPLMAHLAEAGKLSLEDVREMENMLARQNEQKDESAADEQRAKKR